MPRKPTVPFGHINFSPKGKVRKEIRILPSMKDEQERVVVERFLPMATPLVGGRTEAIRLPENDNDFLITSRARGPIAVLECTEVVLRDYATLLPDGKWNLDQFHDAICVSPGETWGTDPWRQVNVLTGKVSQKIAKSYDKPSRLDFWLLIWSVSGLPLSSGWQGGRWMEHPAFSVARHIFYFNMQTRPEVVWPWAL
jgi:hypothetical protein